MQAELDSELADVVAEVESMGIPEWHAMSVATARRVEDDLFSSPDVPEVGLVRDLAFDGPGGEVPIRLYRPEEASREPHPGVVFYHGGGWTLGTFDSIDGVCRRLARRAEVVVVSVDYRLAPEHPFPAAVDDAYAALEWTRANAEALSVDPDSLAVAGTSAGGNLAAATALRARGAGPVLDAQVLCYPILGHDFATESYEANADGPLLTREDMVWFFEQYLRSPVDAANPYAVPLHATDLESVAPAVVVTAGHDPLRDDGVQYADRLADAGVDVAHQHYPSMAHGFLSLIDEVAAADEAFDEMVTALRERL